MKQKTALLIVIAVIIGLNLSAIAKVKQNPKNNFITYNNYLSISGYGPKNSYVVINNSELVTDITGKYEAGLPLNIGKNIFYVKTSKGKIIRTVKVLKIDNFLDVPGGYWAFSDITDMSSLGVVEGLPDGTFNPRKFIEAEVYYSWLCMALGLKPEEPKEDISVLMTKERWRSPYINAIKESGLIPEVSFKDFDPLSVMSRKTVIMQIIRLFKKEIMAMPNVLKISTAVITSNKDDLVYLGYLKGLIKGTEKARLVLELSRSINYAELTTLLSRLPSIKVKRKNFYNWNVGYTQDKITQINYAPVISKAQAFPNKIESNNKDVSTVLVMVDDPEGLEDIKEVRIDMSEIGQGNNLRMFDNGQWGDYKANDSIYSLQFNVSRKIQVGQKDFYVIVRDYKGWQSRTKVSVTSVEPLNALPEIARLDITPQAVKADGLTKFVISAQVKDANGYDDIKSVVADLGDINRSFRKVFKKTGNGNYMLAETVPSEILTGTKIFPVYVTDGAGEYIKQDITLSVVRK